MRKLGYISYVLSGTGTLNIIERIHSIFASIYRKQDLAGAGHSGVFMYRDVFARIRVPVVVGRRKINPFEFVELAPVQLRIIQTEIDQVETCLDQFFDVADIQYGTEELKHLLVTNELVVDLIGLSRLHLHSASAVLTGGYDYRGAVQAALLATELALKAGAASQGLSETRVRAFGHKNGETAEFVGARWPSFDLARVNRVLATQPDFVRNRYSADQPDRRNVGHIVMGAQYIVSEVVRQMSDRELRRGFEPTMARRYPA